MRLLPTSQTHGTLVTRFQQITNRLWTWTLVAAAFAICGWFQAAAQGIQNGSFGGATGLPWEFSPPAGGNQSSPQQFAGKGQIGARGGLPGRNKAFIKQDFECGDGGAFDKCEVYFSASFVPVGNENAYVQLEHNGAGSIRAAIPAGNGDYVLVIPGCGETQVYFYIETAPGMPVWSTLDVDDVSNDCGLFVNFGWEQLIPDAAPDTLHGSPTYPLQFAGWFDFPYHAGVSRGDHASWTPGIWVPKLRDWNRDANGNFIEDVIEQMPADARISVLLDLNRTPCPEDVEFFGAFGEIRHVITAPTIVVLDNVRVSSAGTLANDSRVAMVEFDHPLWDALDTSVASLRVATSAVYASASVADNFPQITGAGVNIAVIDAGVDNGTHDSLPNTRFVAGYDVATGTPGDPDDVSGHGTAVAAAALGHAASVPMRGVATGAGLIDLKIAGGAQPRRTSSAIAAMHTARTNRNAWGVGVVLLALASDAASDGKDAASQTVNDLVGNDIVVVTAIGNATGVQTNHFSLVGEFAAADSALTISGSDDAGQVDRANAALYVRSRSGPRVGGGLKPDVSAPAVDINTALFNTATNSALLTGTSLAAAQVAGVAALVRQANRQMSATDVRQLILDTAEDKGAPGWDPFWGHGLVDGFAAINRLLGPPPTNAPPVQPTNVPPLVRFGTNLPPRAGWPAVGRTDLGFVHHHRIPSPSADLYPIDPNVREGVANRVEARVTNLGPNSAANFQVEIAVSAHSNGDKGYVIATVPVAGPLPPGASITVQAPWTPNISGTPPGVVHSCVYARIIYVDDTDFSNNDAQHNLDIQQTHSPSRSQVIVMNPTSHDLRIEFEVAEISVMQAAGWTFSASPSSFETYRGDCPVQVEMVLTPLAGATPRQRATIRVLGYRLDDPAAPPLDLGVFGFEAYVPTNQGPWVVCSDEFTFVSAYPNVVAAPGVLANDFMGDGLALRALLVTQPAHGKVTLRSDGSFHYQPNAGFVGDDQFTYVALDGTGRSEPATVWLHVVREARLSAMREGDHLRVTWPGPKGAFLLLGAERVGPEAGWRPVDASISHFGGFNTVMMNLSGEMRFFQLLALGVWNCTAVDTNANGIPNLTFYDWNGDKTNDICHVDADEDGYVEERWEDSDWDGRWDKWAKDTDKNGSKDCWWFDRNPRDGKFDEELKDTNGDGRADEGRRDRDGDGWFEERWTDLDNDNDQDPREWGPINPPEPVGPPMLPPPGTVG